MIVVSDKSTPLGRISAFVRNSMPAICGKSSPATQEMLAQVLPPLAGHYGIDLAEEELLECVWGALEKAQVA